MIGTYLTRYAYYWLQNAAPIAIMVVVLIAVASIIITVKRNKHLHASGCLYMVLSIETTIIYIIATIFFNLNVPHGLEVVLIVIESILILASLIYTIIMDPIVALPSTIIAIIASAITAIILYFIALLAVSAIVWVIILTIICTIAIGNLFD